MIYLLFMSYREKRYLRKKENIFFPFPNHFLIQMITSHCDHFAKKKNINVTWFIFFRTNCLNVYLFINCKFAANNDAK